MELDHACGVLGVSPRDEWSTVRQAYRALIRELHPDLAADSSGDPSAVTAAFAVVSAAHEQGRLPQVPSPAVMARPDPAPHRDDVVVLQIPPSVDPFLHLLEVAHRLGEVTYQDANSGLFMVLVHEPGAGLCQLTGEMAVVEAEVSVQFSLESMTGEPAPPIVEVVSRFGELSRTG